MPVGAQYIWGQLPTSGLDVRKSSAPKVSTFAERELVSERKLKNRRILASLADSEWEDDLMDIAVEDA